MRAIWAGVSLGKVGSSGIAVTGAEPSSVTWEPPPLSCNPSPRGRKCGDRYPADRAEQEDGCQGRGIAQARRGDQTLQRLAEREGPGRRGPHGAKALEEGGVGRREQRPDGRAR